MSLPFARARIGLVGALLLAVGVGALGACSQGAGERCEIDSDCASGLSCLKPGPSGSATSPSGTCVGSLDGAVPDTVADVRPDTTADKASDVGKDTASDGADSGADAEPDASVDAGTDDAATD